MPQETSRDMLIDDGGLTRALRCMGIFDPAIGRVPLRFVKLHNQPISSMANSGEAMQPEVVRFILNIPAVLVSKATSFRHYFPCTTFR